MTGPSLEKLVYHYVRNKPELHQFVKPRYFDNKTIRNVYKIDLKFYEKYKELPSVNQIYEVATAAKNIDIDKEAIGLLFETEISDYDEQWLDENVAAWVEFKTLDTSLFDALAYIKEQTLSQENIHKTVETVKSIILERNNIDFNFESGLDFFDPDSHYQPDSVTFSTGYPYFDAVTGGGWEKGCLYTLLGMPKVGKCTVGSEIIKIRNKKTGKIQEISLKDFYEKFNQD